MRPSDYFISSHLALGAIWVWEPRLRYSYLLGCYVVCEPASIPGQCKCRHKRCHEFRTTLQCFVNRRDRGI